VVVKPYTAEMIVDALGRVGVGTSSDGARR
jgi:hypothetical protein